MPDPTDPRSPDGRHQSDDAVVSALVDGLRPTDAGNAERLVAAHGRGLRYVPAWGRWLAWDGTRWRIDVDHVRVTELVKDVPRRLLRRVGEVSGEDRKALVRWATKSESAMGLGNAVRLARSIPGIAVDHHDLDAHPRLLNVINGTINLETGERHDPNPEQLLTQRAPVTYDPAAKAPTFERFLEQVVPDTNVRAYLQRWIGYCLTGDVSEQALAIWWGAGRNGKSTLISIIRALLGGIEYAAIVQRDLLIATRYDQHPTALAELFRKRFATCVELGDGAALDESRIKMLTGGDAIQARRMREDLWSFTPTSKLTLSTNHRPAARADDFALWRRVHLVPFTVTIEPDAIDRDLAARIIHTELSGVLNWALAGCAAWQDEGLRPPCAVRAATEDYRADADTVARFFTEIGLRFAPGLRVVSSDLRRLHDAWADDEGLVAHAHWQLVQRRLKEHGAEPSRSKSARFWTGAGIAIEGDG